ncbi:MAG: tetratricopeptide repeat protein, partial [Dongiaceae bacterium]
MPTNSPKTLADKKHDGATGAVRQRRVVTVVARSGGHARQLTAAAQLERSGKHDAALSTYRKILKVSPQDVDALLFYGRCLSMVDRPRAATAPLEAALKLRPDDSRILLLLGEVRRDLGGGGAAECYERVLARQPDNYLALARLGQVLAATGKVDQGIAKLRAAIAAEPGNALFVLLLANALMANRSFDEARQCYLSLTRMKGRIDGHLGMARLAETLGRFDEALRYLERARRLAPGHSDVLGQLIKHRGAATPPDVTAKARQLANSPELPDRQRAQLHFMLGQAADAAGDSDAAFNHLAAGNRLRRKNLLDAGQFYDKDIIANWFEELIARFNSEFFPRHAGRAGDSELPVFVVGMPRSGTTLTEQILAGHPRVFGAGELGDLER